MNGINDSVFKKFNFYIVVRILMNVNKKIRIYEKLRVSYDVKLPKPQVEFKVKK